MWKMYAVVNGKKTEVLRNAKLESYAAVTNVMDEGKKYDLRTIAVYSNPLFSLAKGSNDKGAA